MADDLFNEQFLKKLQKLYIISKKIFTGRIRGERRTKKVGAGIEFADHRDYSAGDDFRYLDWNIYGRTGRLLLRLFEEEEDLYIYILIDVSASMLVGEFNKLDYAKQVAAALAYIGLSNLDRVSIIPYGDKLKGRLPPSRGKGQIHKVFNFLRNLEGGGLTNTRDTLKTFVHQNKRRGIAVVISDFYDPDGWEDGLNFLRYQKFEPLVIQVYDEMELKPNLKGDLHIIDCETGELKEITVTSRLLKKYKEAHTQFCAELEEFCVNRNLLYYKTPVQVPFDELIMTVLRKGGFLR